jgi:FemAB-related protein (PEP-CTERM system-associated)
VSPIAGIELRAAMEREDEARDVFVRAHPRGTFFHLAGWGRVVSGVFGHRRRDLLALRDGEIVGVLPMVACRGLRGRKSLISMPYGVYGGPVAVESEVGVALYEAAVREAEAEACGRLELRCREDPGLELPGSDLYATFVRDLPEKVEGVLASIPKKARAEARKARERHGLELVEGRSHLDLLVRLFQENKRRLGTPALPARWFHALADEFGADIVVHLVRRGGEPLAAVMSFLFEDTLYAYYSGSTNAADRAYSASNFMYMALQEWCVERGFRRFDFGRSRRDAGAFAFKQHQGFEAKALHYRYHLVRDRGLPSLNPSNPRTRLLQEGWSRLPRVVTRWLARPVSRVLP